MKNNGFTLIELLAVIVILAIILVIAVPQILKVIESSKKDSFTSSLKMAGSAIEQAYAASMLDGTVFSSSGECPQSVVKHSDLYCDYEIYEYGDGNIDADVYMYGLENGKFHGLRGWESDEDLWVDDFDEYNPDGSPKISVHR